MPYTIVRQDITKMQVDAIVNAANTALQMGGGVSGAIFKAAGVTDLQNACDKLAPIQTGEAVITSGFQLPAKFVIHTAGPVYRNGNYSENELLRSCYVNSLKCAIENGCESVAFPLISSGIYGYPKKEALRVATAAIQDFLSDHDTEVSLVVFDKAAFTVSEELLGKVKAFIDENYIDEHYDFYHRNRLLPDDINGIVANESPAQKDFILEDMSFSGLEDLVSKLDEPFSQTLIRLIDAKDKTDVEVYKRANVDRKLFSKIRNNKGYMPSKRTAIAFAIALELTIDETNDLLERAGYTLSHSQKFDTIIEYFITNGKYDIFEINEVLFKYDQPLLGG